MKLLPTPVVTDSFGSRRSTARTEDWESHPGTTLTDAIWEVQGRETDTRGQLLPTPKAADGENASEQGPRHYIEGSDNPTLLGAARRVTGEMKALADADADGDRRLGRTTRQERGDLPDGTPAERDEGVEAAGDGAMARDVEWGVYEPAVRQWEYLTRAAPRPTDDRGRLNPEFVEWMLGFPDGWTEGIPRTQRLKMLGNAVQVQAGELVGVAVTMLQ